MTLAVISLGSNTTRLLVAQTDGAGGLIDLEHGAIGTRLGQGLEENGALESSARERTVAAIRQFVARVRARDVVPNAIATSAMRRASDASAFAREVEALVGAPLVILSGEEEAACSFRGATAHAPRDGARRAVLDIGGGSTECGAGRDGVLETARSVEIGSVSLTERFADIGGGNPGAVARRAAEVARGTALTELASLKDVGEVFELRAVAGTPLTLGAVAFASNVELERGRRLTRALVDATVERLLSLDLASRKALPGMVPQRADVLAGGGLILSAALELLDCDAAILESDDLLLGYLLGTLARRAEEGPSGPGMMVE